MGAYSKKSSQGGNIMENHSLSHTKKNFEVSFVLSGQVYKASKIFEAINDEDNQLKVVMTVIKLWEGERGIVIKQTKEGDGEPEYGATVVRAGEPEYYIAMGVGVEDETVTTFAKEWMEKVQEVVHVEVTEEMLFVMGDLKGVFDTVTLLFN